MAMGLKVWLIEPEKLEAELNAKFDVAPDVIGVAAADDDV